MLTAVKEDLFFHADTDYIYVNVNRKRKKLFFADICFVESGREYVKIFSVSESFLIKGAISSFSKILPEKKFLRIHRRYIVSSQYIVAFDAKFIYGYDFKLPIGRTFKQQVANQL